MGLLEGPEGHYSWYRVFDLPGLCKYTSNHMITSAMPAFHLSPKIPLNLQQVGSLNLSLGCWDLALGLEGLGFRV